MASRREERERLRQARLEREQEQASAQKRKTMLAYVAAGIVGLAVLVGIVVVIAGSGGGGSSDAAHINQSSGSTNGVAVDDRTGTEPPAVEIANVREAAKAADCTLRLGLPVEGKTHVPPGTEIRYKTNPPTSGNHVEPPYQQADGAYSETPNTIDVVHSMEHGRVEVQYSPDLPEADQLAIKGVYDTMYGGTLLFPNPDMPYEVAATAWTNLLGCPTYKGAATLDAVRAFAKATWGKFGGEPANAFTITGPTPAQQ
ncbi:MAG TPA: DUF3105 domain-containing protein [Solirubrobacterales bacterium]|nr:DUF3105 domain-containing protein [Solirubrobacterales bacterium]